MRQERRAGPRQSLKAGVALLLGLWLIATACQSAPQQELLDAPAPSPVASPVGPADPEQPAAASGAGTAESPQLAPSAAPTIQVAPSQPAPPTVRTELAATDPATVNLASGKPTLVEFFAFW